MIIHSFFNFMLTNINQLSDKPPDLSPINGEVALWANALLTTLFGIFGLVVGWWSVWNLFQIAKNRNDAEQRALHITGMQFMLGAFICTPLIIAIVNILIKNIILPQLNG